MTPAFAPDPTTVAVFFPHNPMPPVSGAHQHTLAVLQGLMDLGLQVCLLSAEEWTERPWTRAACEALRAFGLARVEVYRTTERDRRRIDAARRFYASPWWWRVFGSPPIRSVLRGSPDARAWLSRTVQACGAGHLLMNYCTFDGLVDHAALRDVRRSILTHDMVSVSAALLEQLSYWVDVPLRDLSAVPANALDPVWLASRTPSPRRAELQIVARYADALPLCPLEGEVIRRCCPRTRVTVIPATHAAPDCAPLHTGPPVFPTGRTPFNVHGYAVLARTIVPLAREVDASLSVEVTGAVCDLVPPVAGVRLVGHVGAVADIYARACCMITPVLLGTGEQVKIVESMAHGVPVIAWRQRSANSPIRDGENGFLVSSAAEFAQRLLQLWRDRGLCRRLGEAARATIARERSPQSLRDRLEPVFGLRN